MNNRKRMISGFQTTGNLTLGNYLGAIKPAFKLQEEYDLYILIADLHSLTIRPNPKELRANRLEILKTLMSIGFKRDTKIFFQSDIPQHTYLNWILTTETTIGELSRMTQFKDKSSKKMNNGSQSIPTGLLVYPALMAADILIYKSDLVVVGGDQKQHLELTRNIAIRFNNRFGKVFTIPEAFILKEGAKIMSLQDPTKKMSKTDPKKDATIFLEDDPELAYKKIIQAKTDSEGKIYISDEKPGITNLINILALLKDLDTKEIEEKFKESNYSEFKAAVGNAVKEFLIRFQNNKKSLDLDNRASKNYQKLIENLQEETEIIVEKVKKCVGLK